MIAVILPTLDTPTALRRVLEQIPDGYTAYVVDDGSRVPIQAPVRVIRHDRNRGYGAAQKSGYAAALADGAQRIVMLHGDGQYDVADTLALATALEEADGALGSRFLANPGVIPTWRRIGNQALTGLANLRFGTTFSELHTGARAYRASTLRTLPLASFSDDFLFDQQMICGMLRAKMRLAERPVRARYDDTTRSISPSRSITYALGCVWEIFLG